MEREPLRHPAVAGRFYSGSAGSLEREVGAYLSGNETPEKAFGAVMPHAGYVYSGAVAGQTASAIEVPRKVIVMGPNHTGLGPAVSVFPGGYWRMPFGDVPVDGPLVRQIVEECELPVPDETAHIREHSLEVILPFLYYAGGGDLHIVPITLATISQEECRQLGKSLSRVISASQEEILLVASSDMTHYESHDNARDKDTDAISRILEMDPEGLIEVVNRRHITMCGIVPTAVMLFAAIGLGATKARLVRYSTSGEVSGDYKQVVGYAGIIVN